MAKKYLSLEEAAAHVGISEEQLKDARANGDLRGFADRGNWKFRQEDLDEFARKIQEDSSPDVPLFGGDNVLDDEDAIAEQPTTIRKGDSSVLTDDDLQGEEGASDSGVRLVLDQELVTDSSDESVDIPVSLGESSQDMMLDSDVDSDSGSVDIPLSLGDSAEELHLDLDEGESAELALDLDRSDSDVKLASDVDDESLADSSADVLISGQASDSDVRLLAQDSPKGSADDVDSDVLGIDPSASGSDLALTSDVRLINTDSDSDVQLVGSDSDSDVRLLPAEGDSDSDVKLADTEAGIVLDDIEAEDEVLELGGDSGIALDADPDSGISLDMADDSGIALDVGTDSDISLAMDDDESITLDVASDSGISLDVPADSGISLDMPADSGLSLDASATEATIPIQGQQSSADTLVQMPAYSADEGESEFELGELEGESSGDTSVLLFDDEDDATEGASATVVRQGATSEDTFDLEAHDAFDDDDLGDDVFDDDIEDFADDEEFMADEDAFDDEFGGGESQEFAAPTPGMAMAPVEQEWGGLVFGAVLVASLAMMVCGGVMFDLVRYMWKAGENGVVAGPLVDMIGM
ncbi:MAG: helix-turn-helix domain-containing protein [Planctomycetota bacterium]|jgi:hypothetical protein